MRPAQKRAHDSAKSTIAMSKKFKGFTEEGRAAMKERIQELRADMADGEGAALVKKAVS